jgi:hypothetical protein
MDVFREIQRLKQEKEQIEQQILTEKEKLADCRASKKDLPSQIFVDNNTKPSPYEEPKWHFLAGFALSLPFALALIDSSGIVISKAQFSDVPLMLGLYAAAVIVTFLVKAFISYHAECFKYSQQLHSSAPKSAGFWEPFYLGSPALYLALVFVGIEIAVCYNALIKAVTPLEQDLFTTISLIALAGFCAMVNVCLAVVIGYKNGTAQANCKKYEREVYSLKTSEKEDEIIENNRNLDRFAGPGEERIKDLAQKLEYDRPSAYDRSPASDSRTPNDGRDNGKVDPERNRVDHPNDWSDRSN